MLKLWLNVVIGLFVVFQATASTKLDSLVQNAEQQQGFAKVKSYFLLSQIMRSRNPDSALSYTEEAVRLALASDTDKYIGYAYTNAVKVYYGLGKLGKAEEYALLYLGLCEQTNDSVEMAKAYNNLGVLARRKGKLFDALRYQQLSLEMKRALNDQKGMAVSLNNIGLIYSELGLFEHCVQTYKEAVALKRTIGDTIGLVSSLVNLANAYQELNIDSLVPGLLNEALKYAENINDHSIRSGLHINFGAYFELHGLYLKAEEHFLESYSDNVNEMDVGGIVVASNRLASLYIKMHKYNYAENYLKIAEQNISEVEDPHIIFNYNLFAGDLARAKQQNSEAEEYYNNCIRIAGQNAFYTDLAEAFKRMALLYESAGRFERALKYYKEGDHVSDSIEEVKLKRRISNQEVMAQKEYEIKQLMNENRMEEIKLEKSRLLNYSLLINFLVAMVLVVVLLLRSRKYKRQANQLKKSEDELLKNYSLISAIINTIPSPLFYKDVNGIYLGCNAEFERFIGLAKDQIVGKQIKDILPRQSWELHEKMDHEVWESGENIRYETEIILSDGTTRQMVIYKSVFYNEKNEKAGIIGNLIDVSERRQLEFESQQREQFLRLINSANHANQLSFDLLVKSTLRGIVDAMTSSFAYCIRFQCDQSRTWVATFEADTSRFRFIDSKDYCFSDVYNNSSSNAGAPLKKINGNLGPVAPKIFPPSVMQAKEHFIFPVFEEGSVAAVFGLSIPVALQKANPSHLSYFFYDLWSVFARRENYQKILDQEQQLKEANAAKNKFFSIIAHDLKNPFHGMIGFASLLKDYYESLSDEERLEYINILFESATSTYKLLENLLQWANTQTGKISFNPDYVDLSALFDEVLLLVKSNADNKEIEITSNIPFNTILYADSQMVMTILRNLITNSIKFTHRNGRINVSAVSEGTQVTVCVKDTGVGMPQEVADNLFRIDKKNKSQVGTEDEKGTGIGLLLCNEFVQKHGGKIWVQSAPDEGSTFCFTLPNTREAIGNK